MESCSLVVSQILTLLPSRDGDIVILTKLSKIITLKWIIQIGSNFYC